MAVNLENVQWYQRTRGGRTARTATEPQVKITRQGAIVLNELAMGLFGEEFPTAFQVGVIDEGKKGRTVVLQAANSGDADALSVSKPKNSRQYRINTKKFLTDMNMESVFEAAPEFEPDFVAEQKILAFSVR